MATLLEPTRGLGWVHLLTAMEGAPPLAPTNHTCVSALLSPLVCELPGEALPAQKGVRSCLLGRWRPSW